MIANFPFPCSLSGHMPAINRCVGLFVERLAKVAAGGQQGATGAAGGGQEGAEGGAINFLHEVGNFTMAVVGETAYG